MTAEPTADAPIRAVWRNRRLRALFAGSLVSRLVLLASKFANLDPPEMVAALPQHLHLVDWETAAWRRGHLLGGLQEGQGATRQPV